MIRQTTYLLFSQYIHNCVVLCTQKLHITMYTICHSSLFVLFLCIYRYSLPQLPSASCRINICCVCFFFYRFWCNMHVYRPFPDIVCFTLMDLPSLKSSLTTHTHIYVWYMNNETQKKIEQKWNGKIYMPCRTYMPINKP